MPGPDGKPTRPARPLGLRLIWFVGLWIASVATLGAVASVIRLWLGLG